MPDYYFGSFPDIPEGTQFSDRDALRQAKVHLAPIAGIDGNPRVGASSIVLNGGYIDDEDLGDELIYTGHGGQTVGSKKQTSDQNWEATGNKALLVSELHGLPIRVTRGFKHKSDYSPKTGYRYAGLYRIDEHFQERGKDGFQVCRFRLKKIELSTPTDEVEQASKTLPSGSATTNRLPFTTLRIVRDNILSQELKKLYNFTCQVCGLRIELRDIGYAEAAHIRPLGKPHYGPDQPANLLCLCPNHHVMLDKGIFTVNADLTLKGIAGKLYVHHDHKIDLSHFAYHNEHIAV